MGRAKIILTILFALTLSSGLVAGMLVSRLPSGAKTAATRTPLGEALKLSDDQNEKMRKIWEGVRNKVDDCFKSAQEVERHRDQSLVALLTEDQKPKFAKIQQECAASLASLKADRDAMFEQAVAQTKQILDPQQKQRYEEILQQRLDRGQAGSPDWISPRSPKSSPDSSNR